MGQSLKEDTIALTSSQVRAFTIPTLVEHFPLSVEGNQFTTQDIWNVVVAASTSGETIESAAKRLRDAPSPSAVRLYLRQRLTDRVLLSVLEDDCNGALTAHLPKGIRGKKHPVAMDLTLIPYHGQAARAPQEITRSQAKFGTTHFHCYATAYLIKKHKRVTLAMAYVQADETLPEVIVRLWAYLEDLELEVERLYLDKQFCCVLVIDFFQLHHSNLEVILPMVIRGKDGGSKALLQGPRSYRTSYTMKSPSHGAVTFDVAVIRRYTQGRYHRQGVEWFAFALLGPVRLPLPSIFKAYRARFGIESTYRMMNHVRARTASKDPKLRLLLVAVALILVNLWVFLKWTFVSRPRLGGREVLEERFPLSIFRQFLEEEIKDIYGAVRAVSIPSFCS